MDEVLQEYKAAVMQSGYKEFLKKPFKTLDPIPLISRKKFDLIEISSQITLKKDEGEETDQIFELTKLIKSRPEKHITTETKRIELKAPYINLKSFRIEEYITYFENLYREENIFGQKNFILIVKLIIAKLPTVFRIFLLII